MDPIERLLTQFDDFAKEMRSAVEGIRQTQSDHSALPHHAVGMATAMDHEQRLRELEADRQRRQGRDGVIRLLVGGSVVSTAVGLAALILNIIDRVSP